MTSKQKHSTGKFLLSLLLLVPNVFSLILKTTSLIKMEIKLAGKNLAMLVVLSVLFAGLAITSWVCLLILLGLYLVQLQYTLPMTMLVVLSVNMAFLVVIGIKMKLVKAEFSFEHLAKQLRKNS